MGRRGTGPRDSSVGRFADLVGSVALFALISMTILLIDGTRLWSGPLPETFTEGPDEVVDAEPDIGRKMDARWSIMYYRKKCHYVNVLVD